MSPSLALQLHRRCRLARRPACFIEFVLFFFVCSLQVKFGSCWTWRINSTEDDCTPSAIGVGAQVTASYDPGYALLNCDAALMRGALSHKVLEEILQAFLQMPAEEADKLRHANLREGRRQWHLPFSPPFDKLELLGANSELRPVLAAVLGEGFTLDLVTMVTVPADAKGQDLHRDSPLFGTFAAHIPLHAVDELHGPLGICAGTAGTEKEDTDVAFRDAMLWRPQNESKNDALSRIFCGGRQQTDAFHVSFKADGREKSVVASDSRLGAVIRRFASAEAKSLKWQVGDEITHVDGKKIGSNDDWYDAAKSAKKGTILDVQVERPQQGPLPAQPRRALAAPLEVGDMFLYNARAYHWGSANQRGTTRYALFINFKHGDLHEGVHPEASITKEVEEAQNAFQKRFVELRDKWSDRKEL